MNDEVRSEMMRLVERAVHPVWAGDLRKLRMREELLEHFAAVHEEELRRCHDPAVAFNRARERFGDPALLADDLRQSVSRWEHFRYFMDRCRYRAGEPFLGFVLRHLLVNGLALLIMLLVVLPAIWLRGRSSDFGIILHVSGVVALFSTFFSVAFVFLAEQVAQTLYARQVRDRRRLLARYCLVSLLLFPFAGAIVYGGLMLTWESALKGFLLGGLAAPAAPACFVLLGSTLQDQVSRESQWSGIQLDQ